MASPGIYSGGFNLAGTVFQNGPALLQYKPSYLSGVVQWLDTIDGNDANAGNLPELPVKTLAQAVTNSAANGMIVIGEGSAETKTSSQALTGLTGLTIVGCGAGTTRPRYTAGGLIDLLQADAAGIEINNLFFPASTVAPTNRVSITAANCIVSNCYFECGANDIGNTLNFGSGSTGSRVQDSTLIVTASRPAIGIRIAAAVTDIGVKNCTIDGGSYGWSDYAIKITAAATRMRFENVSMLRRSDFGATVTGTSYKAFGLVTDGTSNVLFTA